MRNSTTSKLPLVALFALAVVGCAHIGLCTADERTYKVYHRLGAAAAAAGASGFTERGTIVLSTDASTSDGDGGNGATKGTSSSLSLSITATNAANCIDPAAVDEMIASSSMYTIQVVDESTGQAATASVPGCDVRRASFREELELTLSETGSLLSVTYTPLVSPLAPSCASLGPLAETEEAVPEFQTSVSYETSKPAMTVPLVLPKVKPPPGLKLYPRKKPAAGTGGGGESADGAGAGGSGGGSAAAFEEDEKPQNQSFLMKYWYIILPLMILQFVGGPEPPPQQGEGGDGEGGSAAATSAAGAAGGAVAASAAAPRQRRGKRG